MEIQFIGNEGVTELCINAVLRYLQFGDRIIKTMILTYKHNHALIIFTDFDEVIAVKSGFTSGYCGEGPRGLAFVLILLQKHGAEINEYVVSKKTIEKVNNASLTESALNQIVQSKPFRPTRWHDYTYGYSQYYVKNENLLKKFPPVIPYAILDPRILDLAISFYNSPSENIFTGYRRLEDIVRSRCGIDDYGAKLFQKAFLVQDSILCWPNVNGKESVGRANLFIALYGGYRNVRAHKELNEDLKKQFVEFLTLNHLFSLEADSQLRTKN